MTPLLFYVLALAALFYVLAAREVFAWLVRRACAQWPHIGIDTVDLGIFVVLALIWPVGAPLFRIIVGPQQPHTPRRWVGVERWAGVGNDEDEP
jgi:hypothetical protein